MSKTYLGTHAVDVGGQVVEPGQPIPDGADPDIVKRLEQDGLLEAGAKRPSGKTSGSSEG